MYRNMIIGAKSLRIDAHCIASVVVFTVSSKGNQYCESQDSYSHTNIYLKFSEELSKSRKCFSYRISSVLV
jgi:hypothetical protein